MKNKKHNVLFSLLILIVNVFFVQNKKTVLNHFDIIEINVVLCALFFFVRTMRARVIKKKTYIPAYLLFLNFFRIVFCTLFFIVKIKLGKQIDITYVLNFFAVYFAYIFLEFYSMYKKSKQEP